MFFTRLKERHLDEFPLYFETKITNEFLLEIVDVVKELYNITMENNVIDSILSRWENNDHESTATLIVYNRYVEGFTYDIVEYPNNVSDDDTDHGSGIITDENGVSDSCFRTNCIYFAVTIELFYYGWSDFPNIYYILADFYSWATVIVAHHTQPRRHVKAIQRFSSHFSPLLMYYFNDLFDQSVAYVHVRFDLKNAESIDDKTYVIDEAL
ncbi:hypothetical protein K425_MDEM000152 [Microplitis demolitor]|uniref:conserved uncharacterized protein n=1 Tax=Microplitis demolitor TaxID=69319 RepID=UPI000440033A|nr:conserved uncharacterized protein [Microplitis demolitor]KAG6558462.1 hypothetical protein K425_MDEM000152 [Microplitis demolitor]